MSLHYKTGGAEASEPGELAAPDSVLPESLSTTNALDIVALEDTGAAPPVGDATEVTASKAPGAPEVGTTPSGGPLEVVPPAGIDRPSVPPIGGSTPDPVGEVVPPVGWGPEGDGVSTYSITTQSLQIDESAGSLDEDDIIRQIAQQEILNDAFGDDTYSQIVDLLRQSEQIADDFVKDALLLFIRATFISASGDERRIQTSLDRLTSDLTQLSATSDSDFYYSRALSLGIRASNAFCNATNSGCGVDTDALESLTHLGTDFIGAKDAAKVLTGIDPVAAGMYGLEDPRASVSNADRAWSVLGVIPLGGIAIRVIKNGRKGVIFVIQGPVADGLGGNVGRYGSKLPEATPGSGFQKNHLNQDMAFAQDASGNNVIPSREGYTVALRGRVSDLNSLHSKFHQVLEDFWQPYRRGGDLFGDFPSVGQYNDAMEAALKNAGYTADQASDLRYLATSQQLYYGLTSADNVPRIPNAIRSIK